MTVKYFPIVKKRISTPKGCYRADVFKLGNVLWLSGGTYKLGRKLGFSVTLAVCDRTPWFIPRRLVEYIKKRIVTFEIMSVNVNEVEDFQ
jgi:hypothetical protein